MTVSPSVTTADLITYLLVVQWVRWMHRRHWMILRMKSCVLSRISAVCCRRMPHTFSSLGSSSTCSYVCPFSCLETVTRLADILLFSRPTSLVHDAAVKTVFNIMLKWWWVARTSHLSLLQVLCVSFALWHWTNLAAILCVVMWKTRELLIMGLLSMKLIR